MPEGFTPEFEAAITAGSKEFNDLHPDDSEPTDLQMTAHGVSNSDIILFAEAMREAYMEDLASGQETEEMLALASIIQLALFTGKNLERHRQERARDITEDWDYNWLRPDRGA